ncbi:MAG: EAL domain-containing protein [Hyphomonadaceae bacterium]|nr:EAL domain-containing protein [Hyphomonadaceae bacterium]
MGASPYVWKEANGKSRFAWQNEGNAASLFCSQSPTLPRSIEGLIERICGNGANRREQALATLTWNGAKFQIDYQIRTFDGRNIWVEERGQRIAGTGTRPTVIVGVITDIQNRKGREEQAGYHAAFDSLTGLWNKTRMTEGLTHLLSYAQRYDRQSGYIVFKISNLENINDNFGYEAGDFLLKAVAERLESCVRSPDICARVSEVSFGIGLTDCDGKQMQLVVDRIGSALKGAPYESQYGDLRAEFAIGGIALSQKAVSAVSAMDQVKTAVAHSEKQNGVFIPFSADLPDIKPRQDGQNFVREDIINALNDRRVSLAYQPIIDAKTREIDHFECLLRLKRDNGEIVSAADFIMAAERLDCVHLLDRRALEIAAATLNTYPDIRLALNVSATTVKNKQSANSYLAALKALGAQTSRVTIELTETVALEDPAMANWFSVEARSFGCKFAIDDFGAGHTTFSNLMAIEADEIKIDGSFIRDLSITPHKQVFVRMMVDLAQTFSVKTVAEMVGSRDEAELLTRMGVDYLQGFMFGVPSASPRIDEANTNIVNAAAS